MPLTRTTSDAALEIIALLPLSSIACLTLVQKAWKDFVDANESNIYHNAAVLHRFVPKISTALEDGIASLDFNPALEIRGWKEFCQLRFDIEKNWNGRGPSKMSKMSALGNHVYYRKPIPDSEYTIVASSFCGISVLDAYDTIWALPPDPTFFAYDCGYLAFLRPIQNAIEIWCDLNSRNVNPRPYTSKPSPAQRIAAEATTALYGPPDVGHFVPCYTLSACGDENIDSRSIRLVYPTLLATTGGGSERWKRNQIEMWDISTGQHLRTLNVKGGLDNHLLGELSGIEVSQDFVLAFDDEQVCLFSRHDGNFLFHFSKSATFLPTVPAAVQLLPPRTGSTSAQWDVGISLCGTTLVLVTGRNRVLVIYDLPRLMADELPSLDMIAEVKIAAEYGDPSPGSPVVTRDRIAIGTYYGIIVLTLDRSKTGSGPVPLCEGFAPTSPVQISACFINLRWSSLDSNLHISGTKLFFTAKPSASLHSRIRRYRRQCMPSFLCLLAEWLNRPDFGRRKTRTASVAADVPAAVQLAQQDDSSDDDDMPDLASVSSSDGEDSDEESDDDEDDDPPAKPTGTDYAKGLAHLLNSPTSAHHNNSTSDSESEDDNPGNGMPYVPLAALFASVVGPAQLPHAGAMAGPNETPVSHAFVVDMAPGAEAERVERN
ncbi:hypothetical protein DFH09DRAFT_1100424 [Mycena vulgaris]|nr:hypothetical protein DFH09DRAFT_1100424 [Mycena vulgaris]